MEAHREGWRCWTLVTGEPIRHSHATFPAPPAPVRWYAEALDKVYGEVAPTGSNELAMIVREPIGVIAAVPYRLPAAAWPAGNSARRWRRAAAILKPSEKSPLTALRLAGLAKKRLPDGVLNVVSGFGHEAGQALALHLMLKSSPSPAPPAPASSC